MRPIPAATLKRRGRPRDLRPRLPQLHVMVTLLKRPVVWALLEPIQQLIVLAAEKTAHRGEDAPLDKHLRYLRAVGAMFNVHCYADSISFTATSPLDERRCHGLDV
jgi:hypothetical protein